MRGSTENVTVCFVVARLSLHKLVGKMEASSRTAEIDNIDSSSGYPNPADV